MTLWPRSLVGRNALLIVALMVLAQLGSAWLVIRLVVTPRVDQLADAVGRNVVAIRQGLGALPAAERPVFIAAMGAQLASVAPGPSGGLAGTEMAEDDARPLSRIEQLYIRAASARLARDHIEAVWRRDRGRTLALRIEIDGAEYWLPMSGALAPRDPAVAWLFASITAALLAIAGALAIQRHIDRPLRALVDAARALAGGVRPEPLPEDGPTEIATVSRSFNELVASLQASERERGLMLAGISHDLRTPLTKLRLGVEILGERAEPELHARLIRSIAEIDAIVGQFLDFARVDVEAMDGAGRGSFDAIARDVAASYADHGQPVVLDDAPVPASTMRVDLVRRAVANLVENAFRHGRAPVAVRTGHDERSSWIDVVDAGDGIAASDVEAVKQPFRRAVGARSGIAGAGLGLAIVDRVARMHGGTLELLAAQPRGLCARLRMPLAAAS